MLVSHLKSYTGMGSAQVTCISGCSCDTMSTLTHPVQVHVLVSHLKSYTGMGSAQVTCISGCSCDTMSTLTHPVQVHVLVSHLKSYTGMGSAQVTCIGGCSCDAVTINATLGFNASLTSFAQMQVTPHPACEMQVGGGEGGWSANGASHHPSNCQPPSRRSRC